MCPSGGETAANAVNPLSAGAASCPRFTLAQCAGVLTACKPTMTLVAKYLSLTLATFGTRDAVVMLKAAAMVVAAETLW